MYFLFVTVLQCIPPVSVTGGVPTMMLPLSFVLLVSMIREGYEDYLRHNQESSKPYTCLSAYHLTLHRL